MRILQLINSRGPGGVEVLARELAIELSQQGHDVGLAYISCWSRESGFFDFEQFSEQKLRSAGVQTYELGHRAKRDPFFGARRLKEVVRQFQPDVLHVHLQQGLAYCLLAGLDDIPVVYTHHTDHLKFGKWGFRLLARAATHLVGISNQVTSLLRESVRGPVSLIPNAVQFDLEGTADREPDDPFRVLSVGRFYPEKDYPTLIQAARIAFNRRPDLGGRLIFEIAGDGGERLRLERMIAQNDLQDRVVLLGTRTDIAQLMLRANLLLMTSSFEGLPMVLIEALHAGLPIVATNVGGCSEVVEQERNGLLAPVGDCEQLAEYVLRLVDDRALAQRYGRHSLERSHDFSMRVSARRHLQLYSSILNPEGRNSPIHKQAAESPMAPQGSLALPRTGNPHLDGIG